VDESREGGGDTGGVDSVVCPVSPGASLIPAAIKRRKRRTPAGKRFEHDHFRVGVILNARRSRRAVLDPDRFLVVPGLVAGRLPVDRLQVHAAEAQTKISLALVTLDIAAGATDADRRDRRLQQAIAFAEDGEQTARHDAQKRLDRIAEFDAAVLALQKCVVADKVNRPRAIGRLDDVSRRDR